MLHDLKHHGRLQMQGICFGHAAARWRSDTNLLLKPGTANAPPGVVAGTCFLGPAQRSRRQTSRCHRHRLFRAPPEFPSGSTEVSGARDTDVKFTSAGVLSLRQIPVCYHQPSVHYLYLPACGRQGLVGPPRRSAFASTLRGHQSVLGALPPPDCQHFTPISTGFCELISAA